MTPPTEELRRGEETERYFREALMRLHEVTIALSKVRGFDDVCRRAIELGRERLGFDRLSVWFVADDGRSALGSYGVGEEGQLRDERGRQVDAPPGSPMGQVLSQKKPWLLLEDTALFDHTGEAVGRGTVGLAPLWDGESIIGFAVTDNLLRREPITEQQCEILSLYASAIAHLCSSKQIEGALDIERRQLLSIFDAMDEPVYVSDPETHEVLYANQALRGKFGDVTGRKCYHAFQGLDGPCPFCTNDRIFGESFGEPHIWEFQNQINQRWYHCIDRAIRWPDGRIVRCEMAIDVTDRRRAEGELRESEQRFRDLFEACADAIFVEDLEGNVLDVNPAACRLHGMSREDLIGKNVLDLVPPDRREEVARDFPKLTTGEWEHAEGLSWTSDGRSVPVELRVSRIGYGERPALLLHVRNLSERRHLEEERRQLDAQMQHADKLKSLGVLAGGVAHDFNNLLTAILGNAGLALTHLSPGSDAHKCVEQIRSAGLRAAEITNQMLAYSGQGTFVVEPLDLSRLSKEMSQLLRTCISKKVALEYDLQPDLPAIEADAGQIRQVIMNLVTNAAEAIGDQTGTVTVRTGVTEVDEAHPTSPRTDDELEPGPYVFLEVADTGCGMAPETRSRIFEPFFTTKFTGRGLGLAGVLGIVQGHDGAVEVESTPGVGSSFCVLFPYSGVSSPSLGQGARDESSWQAEGTVLVVDDEEGVRDVMESALARCGLVVLTATNGREGLAVFAEHSQEIDAVVLDLTMPQMDGKETLREIRKLRADARVILTTGFGEQETAARFAAENIAGFVRKPFRLDELIDTVREALEGGS